nr:transposase [Stanieria cyanosphaera]
MLKYVGKRRNVFVGEVDHRGSSQVCPNCRTQVRKELSDRLHSCPECRYEVNRDIASAQELCNRGIETCLINARSKFGRQALTYPGTLEKQEIASQVERAGAQASSAPFESSVVLSGNMVLDKWRRGGILSSDIGKLAP